MKRGFTIIELLVVIAILATLGALIFAFGGKARDKTERVACRENLRQIAIGLESYLSDHTDIMPTAVQGRESLDDPGPAIEQVLADYVSGDVWKCPADDEIYAKTGSSYFWNTTQNGLHRSQLDFFGFKIDPSAVPLIADKEAFHPGEFGTNILYADWTADDRVKFTLPDEGG